MLGVLAITNTLPAQKLPNIQTVSVRAPAGLKIDGKAAEWGNQFKANNKTTDIFYTMANDTEKLYLLIQAKHESIIKKMVMGGVTLSISSNKRDIKNAVKITFPIYDINNPASYFRFNKPKNIKSLNVDSLMIVHNKSLSTKYKLIGVSGIETITDSLLSVYNSEGLNAAALFDSQLNYTYEMAIPLKYLKLNNSQKLTYNIKLNAATVDGRKLEFLPGRNIVAYTAANGVNYVLGDDPQNMTLVAPTDFWGEYTLAK